LIPGNRKRIFCPPNKVQNGFGAHPATKHRVLNRGVKRSGLGVDHSPPFTAEIKNEWSYTSAPLYPS